MKYPKNIKLTREEQQIEDEIEKFVPLSVTESEELMEAIERSKKSSNISLRLSTDDLIRIKNLAQKEGLPYQTLIGSVLHKYSTNQFVEEQVIKKVVEKLRK
ncbi:MAG: antitoxin [Candidatus Magasanikbacteria bacterium]|nr:antitoxin [Candidatus Magasanikbacteria bacterium]